MIMRILYIFVVCACLSNAAFAQSRKETLADIRQTLLLLKIEIDALKAEKQQTGDKFLHMPPDFFERIELFENEITSLINATEHLEFRLDRIVQDGGNRIGDLAFRLCEVDPNCVLDDIDLTPPRFGEGEMKEDDFGNEETVERILRKNPADEMSNDVEKQVRSYYVTEDDAAQQSVLNPDDISEVDYFEGVKKILIAGNYDDATALFADFVTRYPDSIHLSEGYFVLGNAHIELQKWTEAGEAYLKGFEGNPNDAFSPKNLLGLSFALGKLGYWDDACTILSEISSRYPRSSSATQAKKDFVFYNCL